MRSPGSNASRALLIALPSLAIALLWLPALHASFQFDDWNVIVNEPRVHSLAAWWQSMPGIRPLLKLSYALNFTASPAPFGFRIFNVALHAINALLVLWLLQTRGTRAGLAREHALYAAMIGALMFALHPVQTEAVTYISGRSSSLAGCFCLLSLCCWVRSEQALRPRASHAWLAASALLFIFAAATKETAIVLPLALWLYSADQPARPTLRRLVPFVVLAALMLAAALALPMYRHLLEVSLDTRSMGVNLLTQSRAVLYLAGQLVRPGNVNPDPQLPVADATDASAIALLLAWIALIALALRHLRTTPIAAFALLWFLLWLAPTNSLLPRLDIANDRQLYLAMIGPAWWVATVLTAPRVRVQVLGYAVAALMLIGLGYATVQRNRVYATEVSFWEDAAARNPGSARSTNNLGMAYALECRIDAAEQAFRQSIAADPQDFRARINLKLLQENALPGVDRLRCRAP